MKRSILVKLCQSVLPFTLSSICFATDTKSNASVVSPATPAASTALTAYEPRFGIIDMQKIILNVNEGKEARAALEKEIKAKEVEFSKKKEELDKLNKSFEEQAPMLSEDARKRKGQDFQKKVMEYREGEMAFQNEFKQKEGQATQKIAMKATQLVDGMAKQDNLAGVFEVNSSGLVYLKNPVDLTEQVIKKYNETVKSEPKAIGAKDASKTSNKKM